MAAAKGKKRRKVKTSKTMSTTSSAASRGTSRIIPLSTASLSKLLPKGSLAFFDVRKAGKYYGLGIVCPVKVKRDGVSEKCGVTPPANLLGSRRWRWLSAHIAVAHNRTQL